MSRIDSWNQYRADKDVESSLGRIENALGIFGSNSNPRASGVGGIEQILTSTIFRNRDKDKPKTSPQEKAFSKLLNQLQGYGTGAMSEISRSEADIKRDSNQYLKYLEGQVERGEKSAGEASDLFADYAISYRIPRGFEKAASLAKLRTGLAPKATVARYKPFVELASKNLGLDYSTGRTNDITEAARALGKTSPEAFSQFLGATLMSSPEFIRKNPIAFAENLPEGGRYGVGYQTPEGTFTGTYRFKPPTSVNWS